MKTDMLISHIVTFLQLLIAALGKERQTINIAIHKPANQSSTLIVANNSIYPKAELAVDGLAYSDFWSGRSCTHTSQARRYREAWWEVDLQKQYRVGTIRILNREQCAERLHDVSVDVFDDKHQLGLRKHCNTHTGLAGPGWVNISCTSPVTGRFVRITKPHKTWVDALTLCEVELYEAPEIFRSKYFGRMAMIQALTQGEKITARSHLHCGIICVDIDDCFGFIVKEQEHGKLQCQILFGRLDKDGNGMSGNCTFHFALVVQDI